MKKKEIIIAIALAFVLGAGVLLAQPEMPETPCVIKGTWKSAGGSAGSSSWNVISTTECCAIWNEVYKRRDGSSDQYGSFYVTGSCSGEGCSFTQTYTSGDLKGAVYEYTGNPDVDMRTQTLKSVSGTYKQVDGKGKGTFRLNAFVCK